MRSPRKNTLIVSGVLLVLIALIYLTVTFILRNGSADLERRYAQLNVERATDALHAELSDLETTTFDYADWDDT